MAKEIPSIEEMVNAAMAAENENKLKYAYKIERFENGDIHVSATPVEGCEAISDEDIYKDIEDVAAMLKIKRMENAAYAGISRFYAELAMAKANFSNEAEE